ncbi:MAG: hypothetical protein NT067_00605 [Candidatus Diapherotrites archaeon]|nr:hypothetical protein [Candidatus Diapherotrites archaeon]
MWPAFFLFFLCAFTATFLVLPKLIGRMKKRGLVGKDMNKAGMPEIPEMGGIAVWLGFSSAIMLSIFFYSYLQNFFPFEMDLTMLLAGFATIAMVGFLGLMDDLLGWRDGIRQWQHALIPMFAALPLMAININNPPFYIPLIGYVGFGIYYSLLLVPIGITGASNAANMLAGLNGLEAGLGLMIISTLTAIALYSGSIEAVIIGVALMGALLAFLRLNWFPAKVFGGDSLTLMVGAGIATMAIVGDLEKIGILLMSLFFVELVFKARHKFQSECFGLPQKDGTLKADPKGGSLTQWVMRRGRFTETKVVLIILGMQAIICLTVFLLSYFQKIYI